MAEHISESLDSMVRRLFPKTEVERALELVQRYGDRPGDQEVERVRAAMIRLSHGDISRLNRLVGSAREDYQDVLWWAEEEEEGE